MAGYRIHRVSEDIKREIISIIKYIKDPRVQGKMLTVIRVDVSGDLSYAKVYVSDLQGIKSAKDAVLGLESASGYIRRELGRSISIKKTPELKFIADDSIEHGMEISKKIKDTMGDNVDDN
ncbi:MAG: 30S ribosome-binding factor RbfA [Oscillospiraceae bacterium]|jgi:ribosome-binding factor A|nr:30S ribosome-binding factor RbfA [Oscillospiraceae bacterium]